MANLYKMYKGLEGSPETKTMQGISSEETNIIVQDISKLLPAPNYACLFDDSGNIEIVEYTEKLGQTIVCIRGVGGQKRTWPPGTSIARNFTAKDYNSLVDNVTTINDELEGSINVYHSVGDYQIPGEDTKLYRIQKKNNNDAYTVVEIAAPESSNGHDAEATLALMRPVDSESGGPEFLDLYNNGYQDSRQMGIRIQSRGSGQLRDFVFDFNDGSGVNEVLRIRNNGIKSKQNIGIAKDDAGIELYAEDGTYCGSIKRIGERLVLNNPVSGSSIDFYDGGYNQMYFPQGVYIYTDGDPLFFNDINIKLLAHPINSIYLSSVDTEPNTLFGGVWASVTAPTGMYAWKRTE